GEEHRYGCLRAPADIDRRDLSLVKQRTAWWFNFFQRENSFVHSGPIQGATLNEEIAFGERDVNQHIEIDIDQRVWSKINDTIGSDPRGERVYPSEWTERFSQYLYLDEKSGIDSELISEFSLRTFVSYQKTSFSLYPSERSSP